MQRREQAVQVGERDVVVFADEGGDGGVDRAVLFGGRRRDQLVQRKRRLQLPPMQHLLAVGPG